LNANKGAENPPVEAIVVFSQLGDSLQLIDGLHVDCNALMAEASPNFPAEQVDSEDLSFLLYTSGTTGKPEGIMHTTGGYTVQANTTAKWDFDMHEGDVSGARPMSAGSPAICTSTTAR